MRLRARLTIVLVAVLLYVIWNARRFATECDLYSQQAQNETLPSWASGPKEAIVVLTGSRGRIPRAIQLLRTRDDGLLLISGAGKGITKKELLNQQGDAAGGATQVWERIEVEDQAASTIENAEESAKFLKDRKIEKVILVTSDYHMPRALAIFRRVHGSVEYFPFPVSVPASDGSAIEAYAKPTIEFFKWFVFRHFMVWFL
jgi:uncharacterized SAM-binding protein YcdF (DUF218 family)